MSKKYNVKTRAIFNGQPAGSTIVLSEKSAKKYEAMKYVEIISEVKPKSKPKSKPSKKASAKTESKPKKPATKTEEK